MMLADEILAATRTWQVATPLADVFRKLAAKVMRAQRILFDAGATLAAHSVAESRPRSLLAAIHLRRPPFDLTWVEYPMAELNRLLGKPVHDAASDQPTPRRVGFLIDSSTTNGSHCVTVAWSQSDKGVNVCPICVVMLDDPRANELVDQLEPVADKIGAILASMGLPHSAPMQRPATAEELRGVMRAGRIRWSHLPDAELEALAELQKHWFFGVPECWQETVFNLLGKVASGEISREAWSQLWAAAGSDLEGEPALLSAMLVLLNSRNAVAVEAENLDRLNRARLKAGKSTLLSHSVVRLSLSRVQQRRAYGGVGSVKRLHLVRGHFKLKPHGVYFWNAHMRGDPRKGEVKRSHYEIAA